MAGLTTESKSNIAFKKLVGKAHTSNQIPFYSESIASQVWIGFDEVLGESIPTDPQTAVNNGVAEFVECELEEIPASNGLAYDIVFPSGYSGNFAATGGDLVREYTQVVAKKNNLNDVAKSNHSGGYVYDLFDGGNRVALGATENWQVDPVSGIVVSEDSLNLGSDGTIRLYLYTGKFLNQVVSGGVNVAEDEVAFGSSTSGVESSSDLTYDGNELRVKKDLRVEGNFGFDQGTNVSVISSDTNLGGGNPSHDNLATQAAIKTYVDNQTESTDVISEGSNNLYYTDERVDDRVNALLTTGSDLTKTYNDATNTLTLEVSDTIDLGTL